MDIRILGFDEPYDIRILWIYGFTVYRIYRTIGVQVFLDIRGFEIFLDIRGFQVFKGFSGFEWFSVNMKGAAGGFLDLRSFHLGYLDIRFSGFHAL